MNECAILYPNLPHLFTSILLTNQKMVYTSIIEIKESHSIVTQYNVPDKVEDDRVVSC
jgi:hypothetical protein